MGKLRLKGKLIIGGNDIYEIAKNLVVGGIDSLEANHLLFGKIEQTWEIKRCCINIQDLVDLLNQLGMKIVKKQLVGMKMLVEAIRE